MSRNRWRCCSTHQSNSHQVHLGASSKPLHLSRAFLRPPNVNTRAQISLPETWRRLPLRIRAVKEGSGQSLNASSPSRTPTRILLAHQLAETSFCRSDPHGRYAFPRSSKSSAKRWCARRAPLFPQAARLVPAPSLPRTAAIGGAAHLLRFSRKVRLPPFSPQSFYSADLSASESCKLRPTHPCSGTPPSPRGGARTGPYANILENSPRESRLRQ